MGILRWHKTRGSERQRKRCDAHAPKRFPCGHVTTDPAPTPLVSSAGVICGFAAGIRAHLGPVTALLFQILFPTYTKESLFMQWRFMIRKNGRERKIEFNGLPGKENEMCVLTLARSSQWDHRCNASSPATALLRDLVASGTSAWVRIVVLLWLSACAA